MRIHKADGSVEKRILIGMITNDTVCSRVSAKWKKTLFRNKWSALIAGWCNRHYIKYGKAPGKSITAIFQNWAEKEERRDKTLVEMVEKFLSNLSAEYVTLKKDVNPQHVMDLAMEFFSKNELERVKEGIEGAIEQGDYEAAIKCVASFSGVELTGDERTDVFDDDSALVEMMEDNRIPLFTYPKAAGGFFGDCFCRNSFVCFLAPEKRGKTWWLMDVTWRALKAGNKVAFFSVGDMSQTQFVRRLAIRAAKRPLKGGVKYDMPINIMPPSSGEGQATTEFKSRETPADMTLDEVRAAIKAAKEDIMPDGGKRFRLSTHYNSSLSINGISDILKRWEREDGFVPDVVVIDYMDILLMPEGGSETRDQVNASWKAGRRLSQMINGCLVSATQANAQGGEVETLTRANFSEDKRKLAHVTDMIGLNQTDTERRYGIYRPSWIVRREGEMCDPVWCAGSLSMANPCMISAYVPVKTKQGRKTADE